MRPSGTAEQLEKRRRQAIALLQAGTPYREVARRIEASLSSVVRWEQAYRRDKRNGLRLKGFWVAERRVGRAGHVGLAIPLHDQSGHRKAGSRPGPEA